MAETIVSIAVETLRRLLLEEGKFLSGVTDEVQEVRRELTRMQCFLRDADRRDYKDETVRNWLREIKSLAYRAEDVVETFAVEVASKKQGRELKKVMTRFACIFCECRSIRNLGLEIAKLKTDISNLNTSLERYGVKAITEGESSRATNENQISPTQTYAHEVEEYFVGMEEDIKKLVSFLVDGHRQHHIISVWGMGGVGKTTIARKVYKHRKVQSCFERFAWVCITQQCQIKGTLRDILIQLLPEKKEEVKLMEHRQLVEQLYRVQKESKCLVVIGDIWYMHDWENLVHAFPVVEGHSKILLTTRTKQVAEIGFTYELKCLGEKESWKLLKLVAFSRKNVEDLKIEPNLEAVGIDMVRKCGGLPLAICIVGGILKDKNSLRDWQIVSKNIDSYLSKGEGSEERSDGGAIARVLSLSYNVLPYHLKPCFLYMGSFREDEDIDVEQLYLLWIAEDMVLSQHQRSGETLREVAERYLNELGKRSMVQLRVNDLSMFRRFDSCHLHDMMRDFCLKKGREEEFMGVIDIRGVKKPLLDSPCPINNNNNAAALYRLVIHISGEVKAPVNANTVLEDYKQLRSLLLCGTYVWSQRTRIIWPNGIVNYGINFKSLRVVMFEGHNFEGQKLPTGLEKLIHLRFLSLRDSELDKLPSSVFNLQFLQSLDLRVVYRMELPNIFGRMKRLRHLYLPSKQHALNGKEKLRFDGLTLLETLDGFQSFRNEISDLHALANLRLLTATVTDDESLCDIINHLSMKGQNLQETFLKIKKAVSFTSSQQGSVLLGKVLACGNIHRLNIEAKIRRFPQYEEHFLHGLVGLRLKSTSIHEDPMETLEKLPQLRYLELAFGSYTGKEMICHEMGFPQLRKLSLSFLFNLSNWRVHKGGMLNLSHLTICLCPALEMIPDGLKYVACLKELYIEWMPTSFVDRIEVVDGREGTDFDKIRHIPSVRIRKKLSDA